jgi:hypothetical protein
MGMAQLGLKIEKITISNVVEKLQDDVAYLEGFGEGPNIHVECLINNNSKDTVFLYPSNAIINIVFTYKQIEYTKKVFPFQLMKNDFLVILPYQDIKFEFNDTYILGCDWYNWKKISLKDIREINHSEEVIATLPTLRVQYRDKNTNIITSGIKEVTIED